jgi:hypothetical protein
MGAEEDELGVIYQEIQRGDLRANGREFFMQLL